MKLRNVKTLTLALALGLTACGQNNSSGTPVTNEAVAANEAAKEMPELHKILTHEFAAPYSCKGSYNRSALFLSNFSKQRNSPDLLFNGACGSALSLDASTAGDDFALISDLGPVSIESVSASKAINLTRMVGGDNTFQESKTALAGHTYVILISKSDIRALYVLHIDEILPDGRMRVSYAVKSYSIQTTSASSPGFDWEKESTWK